MVEVREDVEHHLAAVLLNMVRQRLQVVNPPFLFLTADGAIQGSAGQRRATK